MIREDVIAFARGLAGLTADPVRPACRARYLALIAPGETEARAAGMSTMSGCELACRGILRAFIAHPLLDRPYVDQHAGRDLLAIATEARAVRHHLEPEAGDVVIVGGGLDGGGPEHAFMVLSISVDPFAHTPADHVETITAIEGGHVDESGHQAVRIREHELNAGHDTAPGSPRRLVRFVLDTGAILRRFGR